MQNLSTEQLEQQLKLLEAQRDAMLEAGGQYDLRRGRPSLEQLALSHALDNCLNNQYVSSSGIDARLYGREPHGITEMRALFADVLDVAPEQTLVYGNSSLQLIYFAILFAWLEGASAKTLPWSELGGDKNKRSKVRFLCPVPGYDRHFRICERLGIDMQPIAMDEHGPDMDAVEKAVRDTHTKGLFCVPRFSNPSGLVYSQKTVERIARLGQIAAPDFRIFWDNAYALHAFDAQAEPLHPIMPLCREYGTEDSVFLCTSTSKISLSGAGVAAVASSQGNIERYLEQLSVTSIGSDHVNQLRHARVFTDIGVLQKHMEKHAAILRPKFELLERCLCEGLEAETNESAYGSWSQPRGGYFVLFHAHPGCAEEIVRTSASIGLHLTPAGATHPYGKDPNNSEIRLAPTALELDELAEAMRRFTVCAKLVSVRHALNARLGQSYDSGRVGVSKIPVER